MIDGCVVNIRPDGYINASELCDRYGRDFHIWVTDNSILEVDSENSKKLILNENGEYWIHQQLSFNLVDWLKNKAYTKGQVVYRIKPSSSNAKPTVSTPLDSDYQAVSSNSEDSFSRQNQINFESLNNFMSCPLSAPKPAGSVRASVRVYNNSVDENLTKLRDILFSSGKLHHSQISDLRGPDWKTKTPIIVKNILEILEDTLQRNIKLQESITQVSRQIENLPLQSKRGGVKSKAVEVMPEQSKRGGVKRKNQEEFYDFYFDDEVDEVVVPKQSNRGVKRDVKRAKHIPEIENTFEDVIDAGKQCSRCKVYKLWKDFYVSNRCTCMECLRKKQRQDRDRLRKDENWII